MGLGSSHNGQKTKGQSEDLELHLGVRFKNESHKLFFRDCRPVIWPPDIEEFEVSLAQADEAFKATKASLYYFPSLVAPFIHYWYSGVGNYLLEN